MKRPSRITPLEIAIGASILGSLLAVAIPSFARNVHATHFAEATDGLARLGTQAVAHADAHKDVGFPKSAPLTPAEVPRGARAVDPPGTWDHPTWTALGFRASPEGIPHAFSFAFDGAGSSFTARARGDLDGDGVLSTFETRGVVGAGAASLTPGMYVEAELE
ncbi:MAG: hypothetical protein JNL38_19360 [Myxococcales bacterium]|jgi:hypothetical protein|nr:hypothetical protein [Myxococcales bacterium]